MKGRSRTNCSTSSITLRKKAERVGYSNYSYWGSVVQNFLKHKAAVVCLFLFLFLVIFSFIALAIGKYDYQTLVSDSSLAFRKPNSEYWFGTDNLGRDYWCQVWYATQVSIRLALIVAVGESILGVIIELLSPDSSLFWSFFALNLVMLLLSYAPVFPGVLRLREIDPDSERPFACRAGAGCCACWPMCPWR